MERVLRQMEGLSNATLASAIEGISSWLHRCSEQVVRSELGYSLWHRVWPIGVEATNTLESERRLAHVGELLESSHDRGSPNEIDTLGSPTGKLTGVLIEAFQWWEEIGVSSPVGGFLSRCGIVLSAHPAMPVWLRAAT